MNSSNRFETDRRSKAHLFEAAAEAIIKVIAFISIAAVILILVFIGKESIPVWLNAGIRNEVGPMVLPIHHDGATVFSWQPVSEIPKYNILPLWLGTLKVTLVAMVIAVPLSIGAAMFVSEYAPRRVREIVKPVIELLAGIPSVVIGFFALVVLSTWIQSVFGVEHKLNAITAGVGLSFAICPIIFSVAEDSLRAVPDSFRTAAIALGATRAQVLLSVTVPAALPGIMAAVFLGFGRAIGETLIVVLASGNAALVDADLGHSTRTLTATIAQELGEVVVGSAHYHVLFALGVILFLCTLIVNLVGERVIHRMRQRLGGNRT